VSDGKRIEANGDTDEETGTARVNGEERREVSKCCVPAGVCVRALARLHTYAHKHTHTPTQSLSHSPRGTPPARAGSYLRPAAAQSSTAIRVISPATVPSA